MTDYSTKSLQQLQEERKKQEAIIMGKPIQHYIPFFRDSEYQDAHYKLEEIKANIRCKQRIEGCFTINTSELEAQKKTSLEKQTTV